MSLQCIINVSRPINTWWLWFDVEAAGFWSVVFLIRGSGGRVSSVSLSVQIKGAYGN